MANRQTKRKAKNEMNEEQLLEALRELSTMIDDLRAAMPMDSKRAEQLSDAYYLIQDAIAND
jgi:hypothetical protein